MEIFLKSLYLPLITCHMFKVNHLPNELLFVYAIISLIIFMIHVIKNLNPNVLNLIIIVQFSLLVFLSLNLENIRENFWLIFFLALYLTNHFGLPCISERFCIPRIDLLSMSLVFLNTFLINAFSWLRFLLKTFCRDCFFFLICESWNFMKHFSVWEERKKTNSLLNLVSLYPFSWAYAVNRLVISSSS